MKCIVSTFELQYFEINQFFFKIDFWEIERKRQMTDREDIFHLGKIVFEDNNQEKNAWSCLGLRSSRSLNVFLSQLFVILLITFDCFWRFHFSRKCDEATAWVGNLCSATGYILPSWRIWTSQFLQKTHLFLVGRSVRNCQVTTISQRARNWNVSTQIWQKLQNYFFINACNHFTMLCRKKLIILNLFKVYTLNS